MPEVPLVRDLRGKISSLLPQNIQARVLAGVALLMTLVILFSGRPSHPEKKSAPPPAAAQVTDPNQARIQEYRAGIEAATRQLAAEEAQLAQAKQALAEQSSVMPKDGPEVSARAALAGETAEHSAVSDRQKREEESLFASNIALTYRPAARLEQKREPGPSVPMIAVEAAPPPATPVKDETGTYRLAEGTIIETVLTNRLDSTFSGPINCLVTTNVYSPDHATLLIPQGSRVLGEVRKLESLGEQRLAVFFHRLIRPDGYSLSLDKFQGLNQIGETGLRDKINHHYFQVFGASLAIGAVAGLAQANTRYGLEQSAADAYEQGVASSLSQSSIHVLDRYLNVLPTFTIREGHRIKVYLSQDLKLPAYDAHREF